VNDDVWSDPVEASSLSCDRAPMRPCRVESNNSLVIPRGFPGVLKGKGGAVKGMMGIPGVLAVS
jgi:hypothetical protein